MNESIVLLDAIASIDSILAIKKIYCLICFSVINTAFQINRNLFKLKCLIALKILLVSL